MKFLAIIAALLVFVLGIAGCAESEDEATRADTEAVAAKPAPKPPAEEVSPSCEEVRELADLERSNPKANARYLHEYEAMVKEECGPVARARWARIQHEQTPEGEEEHAEEYAENAEQVQEETAEVEKVLKERQAQRTAAELESLEGR